MVRQGPKMSARVVNAIRNLHDVHGSTSKQIMDYIMSQCDGSDAVIQKQTYAALKRGLDHGILKKSRGLYSLNSELDLEPRHAVLVEAQMKSRRRARRRARRRGRSRRGKRRRSRRRKRSRRRRSRSRSRGSRRRRRSGRRRAGSVNDDGMGDYYSLRNLAPEEPEENYPTRNSQSVEALPESSHEDEVEDHRWNRRSKSRQRSRTRSRSAVKKNRSIDDQDGCT